MYRFNIFNEHNEGVRTVIADSAHMEGTVIAFSTKGEIEQLFNLPPGYSIIKEDA